MVFLVQPYQSRAGRRTRRENDDGLDDTPAGIGRMVPERVSDMRAIFPYTGELPSWLSISVLRCVKLKW